GSGDPIAQTHPRHGRKRALRHRRRPRQCAGFWLRGAQGRDFRLRAGGKLIAYSGLMLAALITLAHFSVSPTKCFSNSDGGPLSTLPPRSVIRAPSVGSASPPWSSLFVV